MCVCICAPIARRSPQSRGRAESLTPAYVLLLGLSRLFYLGSWVHRYATEGDFLQLIVWIARVGQTALFIDFAFIYAHTRAKERERTRGLVELETRTLYAV